MTQEPVVSVCILAGHGDAALEACLDSLARQELSPPFELLVGGNPTPQLVALVHDRWPEAQVCRTGRRLPGSARNPLVERARGELLLFLDDDVTVPGDLLANLAAAASRYPEASVFGGPNDTPPRSSRFQVVQGAVLSSLMGAGPVSRRYGARHSGLADERWFTLCNLAIRRRVMSPFLSHLVCAEENALLAELRNRGEKMRYDPRLRVFHDRRPTWRSFARQMFKYGRGRGMLLRRQPKVVRAAYLAPTGLLFYALVAPILLLSGAAPLAALAPGTLYAALTIANALRVGLTLKSLRGSAVAAVLIPTIHICYGAGILRGVVTPARTTAEDAAQWTSAALGPGQGPEPALEYDSASAR